LTTKIHLLCDALGNPLRFIVTGGEVADCTQALPLLENHNAAYVLADKGYDSNEIVDYIQKNGATPVIPPKKNRIEQRYYDKEIYKDRHLIECCFSKLKHFRKIATRYEKYLHSFKALVAIALSCILLR
jgi:transposase